MATRSTLRSFVQGFFRVSQATLIPLLLLAPAVGKDGSPGGNDKSVPVPQTNSAALHAGQPSPQAPAPSLADANQMLQRQGPLFIENRGQFDPRVKFLVTGSGANLWLTNEGIVFDFQRPPNKQSVNAAEEKPTSLKPLPRGREALNPRLKSDQPPMERLVFKQRLVSPNPNPTIEARDPQPGIYNYFPTSDPDTWRTHVLAYKEVVYRDIWKGIDLKLFANGPNLEEEFIVHPGADPGSVQLAYEGIEGLSLADDGSLKVATAFGDIVETSPRIYQEIAGNTVPLSGSLKVGAQNSYSFEVAKRDEKADLIIDPTVIYSKTRSGRKAGQGTPPLYSSFLGGSQVDQGNAIAVDNAGNAYVTGTTASTDFPTMGAFQGSGTGVFITKVNALGGAPLVYSTYLGQAAHGQGIAVDSSGSAYVVGGNTNANFPTTANAYNQAPCGAFGQGGSAFFTKLSPAGDALIYSTCLGAGPTAYAVAVDAAGNAYLTGANVFQGSLPTTPDAYQPSDDPNTQAPAFLSVINPSASGASSLVYSTYFGGTPQDAFFGDRGLGVAVDAYGMVYMTGWTTSLNFPVTAGAYWTLYPGQPCCDFCGCSAALGGRLLPSAFIAKFNPQASGAASLIYSTFLGGSLGTIGYGLAVDSLGNAYVTGSTGAWYGRIAGTVVPFPTTAGAYQTVPDNNDAFVTKCNAAGNNLIYSTLLGGAGNQWSTGIALDASNDAYVTGFTSATNFPPAGDAFLPNDPNPAFQQGFVTQFNSTGTGLLYSSYLGGTASSTNGDGGGIAVDQVGDAYVTGLTQAIDFPVTSFAFQPLYAGNGDAFVTDFLIGAPGGTSITGILPNAGGNAGSVSPEIVGSGFYPGATAQLNCSGRHVMGQNVTVSAGGRILNTTFDLTSTSPGICDVMVTNPNLTSATLPHGFTVQQGGAPNIQVQKIGTLPLIHQDGAPTIVTYVILVSNTGNIDVPRPFLLDVLDSHFTLLSVDPPDISDPPQLSGQSAVLWGTAIGAGEGPTFSYSVVVDPATPAGTVLLGGPVCFSGDPPTVGQKCQCMVNLGGCTGCSACATSCSQSLSSCAADLATCCNQTTDSCKTNLNQCNEGVLSPLQYLIDGAGRQSGFRSQRPSGAGVAMCALNSQELKNGAGDPNYLAGPPGIGTQNWVSGAAGLPYVISFGNDPMAGSAAQQIVVTQPLDPSIDVSTLRLTFATVPNLTNPAIIISIPPGSFNPAVGIDEFMTTADLRPVQSLFVTLDAKFNPNTNTITWSFNSIDPTTGLPPTNPLIGMLPPGEGAAVSFVAKARQGLPTGTPISDQASVIFNTNPPVSTNIWTNALDNTPPTSHVTAFSGNQLCPSFTVQWSGTDIGSGVASYTIYVSDNGGAFTAWQTNTTSTSAVYNGQVGHGYGFYSIAQDLVGNIEPGKSSAEATTQVNKGTICGPVGPPTVLGGERRIPQ